MGGVVWCFVLVFFSSKLGGGRGPAPPPPPPATTFTDPAVPAGAWRYAVTAVDASAGANESARSPEVPVTVD